jgi:hypothetical protein
MLGRVAVAVVASAATVVLGGVPAVAHGTGSQPSSVHGLCTVTVHNDSGFGGWCAGTGPDEYRVEISCTDGSVRDGAWRWFGDRRGSYAYCPRGAFLYDEKFQELDW